MAKRKEQLSEVIERLEQIQYTLNSGLDVDVRPLLDELIIYTKTIWKKD